GMQALPGSSEAFARRNRRSGEDTHSAALTGSGQARGAREGLISSDTPSVACPCPRAALVHRNEIRRRALETIDELLTQAVESILEDVGFRAHFLRKRGDADVGINLGHARRRVARQRLIRLASLRIGARAGSRGRGGGGFGGSRAGRGKETEEQRDRFHHAPHIPSCAEGTTAKCRAFAGSARPFRWLPPRHAARTQSPSGAGVVFDAGVGAGRRPAISAPASTARGRKTRLESAATPPTARKAGQKSLLTR